MVIDGRELQVQAGQTVLEAALANGIQIPHLCHDLRLEPIGSCSLCLVEIEGERVPQLSCTLEARPGMVVRTDTDELRSLRKTVLSLLLSEHHTDCIVCDKNGDCELQDLAYEYGVNGTDLPYVGTPQGVPNFSAGNEAIEYDPSKCVRCQRCVQICAQVQVVHALTLRGRALDMQISTAFDMPLNDSTCEMCGQCVSTCPTAALYERKAKGKGQAKDLTRVHTTCPYCGVGCQIILNVNPKTQRIVRVTSPVGCIPNDGNLCIKGRFGLDFVHSPERLTHPLIRGSDGFRQATWDEALSLVARRFGEIKREYGPDALAGLSSAKTTNEDNYIMQKMVRTAFGTNNIDHCARLCHASTVAGLARAFGSGAMTNSIGDLVKSPLIFVIGSNTTECHPVIGIMIRQAVVNHGRTLIVADPRKISLCDNATIHLRQRSGTDVALINAMIHVILSEGLESEPFIEERLEGFVQLRSSVQEYTPEMAERITGVAAEDIRRAARLYASAPTAAIVYSMGITQHWTGTDNVLALANLAMITGNVGKEGAGVNPLRGQNNVQGACDLGALPNVFPGYQPVTDRVIRAKFEKAWGLPLPAEPGQTVVEIVNAAGNGDIRCLYIVGENPALSDPDINHVRRCLERVDFLVVQDIFLSETAALADVVLPAASFAEKDGTFTNTERRVQRVRKAVPPPGTAREDWRIVTDIATRMGYPMHYDSASSIMEEIADLTPIYGGISYDRLEQEALQWPCLAPDHSGTPILHREHFARGKGLLSPVVYLPPAEVPDADYPLVLSTGRLLEQWHTGTMSRKSNAINQRVPRAEIEIHPSDAERLDIVDGQVVRARSRRGHIDIAARVTSRVLPGSVFVAFHFHESPANALTIAALDPTAKIPEFKACAVRIEKIAQVGAVVGREESLIRAPT